MHQNLFLELFKKKKTKNQILAMSIDKKIIIIGAGASGIAAATKLISHGFQNVLLLEAESRIGGRIHTIPFGANVLDIGAQW